MITEEIINKKIFIIKGYKIMFDRDLAELYKVETKVLNRAVKRNQAKFPEDFMFQLTSEEFDNLRCQFGTSSWGGRRYKPRAFTEHGVLMLASVLNSDRAVHMSIFIVRAFIKMRELLSSHKELAHKVDEIERKQKEQGGLLASVYAVVKQLIQEPETHRKKKIGFDTED